MKMNIEEIQQRDRYVSAFAGDEKGLALYLEMRENYDPESVSSSSIGVSRVVDTFEGDSQTAVQWVASGMFSGCLTSNMMGSSYFLTKEGAETLDKIIQSNEVVPQIPNSEKN